MGSLAVLFATGPWGIGVGDDSMFYLTSASSLLAGHGLQWLGGGGVLKPLVHFPPLYPVLLALLGGLGFTAIDAARWLAVVLFGLNAILGGYLVGRNVGGRWAPIVASCVFVASPTMFANHLEALSEPLFYLTLMMTWVLVIDYLEQPTVSRIVAAGLATAMAALTRYVGPALAASVLLTLLVLDQRALRTRLRAGIVYLSAALGPLLLWYLRNYLVSGSATNRVLAYHPIVKHDVFDVVRTAVTWLMPDGLSWRAQELVFGIGTVGFIGLVAWFIHRENAREGAGGIAKRPIRLVVLLIAFAVCYAGLLAFSKTLLDASTRFTDRILSPFYLVLVIAMIVIVAAGSRARTSLAIRAALLGAVLLVMGAYLDRSIGLLSAMRLEGREFSGRAWRTSGAVAWLRNLPPSTPVYSNEAAPILFLTGIPAMSVPERIDSVQSRARADFSANLTSMRTDLRTNSGVLVVFPQTYASRPEYAPLAELTAGMVVEERTADAVIFAFPAGIP